MFQRIYTVKGEDVCDFMVMQNTAYLKYVSKLVDTFLYQKGFSSAKMNTLKVGLQKNGDLIKHKQHLMFTQSFSVKLEFCKLSYSNNKMNIKVHFYNNKEELCTTVTRDFFWFNYATWKTTLPPKTISKYFLSQESFRNAS
jgi:acyl-CoA thioesterase FadM